MCRRTDLLPSIVTDVSFGHGGGDRFWMTHKLTVKRAPLQMRKRNQRVDRNRKDARRGRR